MKIMVTGGAGFIGSHIVDSLIEEGHRVVIVDNLLTGDRDNINPMATFYEMDILDKELDEVMERESPEVIFHLAALVYVQQSIENPVSDGVVNAIGTLNVLRLAALHKVRKIIYSSTCAVYGHTQDIATKEDAPILPISFYGASKHMGEVYIRLFHELFNLDYTILRYANVYGPRQKQHGEGGVTPIFIQNMKKGITCTIFGDGNQIRDFIYVKDVAKANVLALDKGTQQTFNIGTGAGITINYLYKSLDEVMKYNLQVQYKPERIGDVKEISLNPSKAEKELKWKASYLLSEGLRETIEFYNSEGRKGMKVSLVMGVFNGEEYLKETVDSILAQTYKDLEIIFVNDGSTDSTPSILNEIKDERVRVIHLDVNKGVANALNIGIAQAKGHYIAIHDADDISLPNRIEEQIAYLSANPHVIAVGSFIECIGGKDISTGRDAHMRGLERYKNSIITWEQIKSDLFKGSPITHGSLLMTKEAYLKAGKYDTQYKIASDYDFYTRLANIGPIENVPKILYKYRISANSLSNSNVKETSDEFLLASTRYIRSHCFAYKGEKPSVVVYGTKEGSQVFKELMSIDDNFSVHETMFIYERGKVKKAYKDYKTGKLDAFIILTNGPEEDKLIKFLTKKGLKLNKDYFTLWSAL